MVSFPAFSRTSKRALLLSVAAIIVVGIGASVSMAQFTRVFGKTPPPNRFLLTSRVLEVPLKLDRNVIPKLKEVCLYGKDGSGEWRVMARTSPSATSITIEVPHDGEYA